MGADAALQAPDGLPGCLGSLPAAGPTEGYPVSSSPITRTSHTRLALQVPTGHPRRLRDTHHSASDCLRRSEVQHEILGIQRDAGCLGLAQHLGVSARRDEPALPPALNRRRIPVAEDTRGGTDATEFVDHMIRLGKDRIRHGCESYVENVQLSNVESVYVVGEHDS